MMNMSPEEFRANVDSQLQQLGFLFTTMALLNLAQITGAYVGFAIPPNASTAFYLPS